jgi:uncharacterized protein involved in cysteine biosynthesis
VLDRLRRLVSGAWQLPKAFLFLGRRPRLWPAALLPALATAVLITLGLGLGLMAGPYLEAAVFDRSLPTPAWNGFAISLGVRLVAIVAGVLGGLGTALVLAAPLLDRLSRGVEAAAKGQVLNRESGLRWEVAQSMRGAGYFLLRAPGILAIGFVPFVGPALSALWAAHALAFQNTEPALGRRGLEFSVRRAWHRRHRAESLGLGFASLACLLVPCAGLLLAPALVTAGTLLVLELAPGEENPGSG